MAAATYPRHRALRCAGRITRWGGPGNERVTPKLDLVTVALNTDLKPKPGWDAQQDPDERRHIEASAETYEEAYRALKAQVPEGWFVIGVKRW